jgi:uncharacterized protein RhaS with RHS repeats
MPTKYRYPIMDHRGSVVALTDETGAVVARREYNAFGDVLAESGDWSGFRFGYQSNWMTLNGDLYLTESGRVYDAKIGRHLQREPNHGLAGD